MRRRRIQNSKVIIAPNRDRVVLHTAGARSRLGVIVILVSVKSSQVDRLLLASQPLQADLLTFDDELLRQLGKKFINTCQ